MAEITRHDLIALEEQREICQKCLNWKDFKENCWYHWNFKKECSQKIIIS